MEPLDVDRYALTRHEPGTAMPKRREPRNLTPTFMRLVIEAWRKDFKLLWAVYKTAEQVGCDLGNVYGHPKTPSENWFKEGMNVSVRCWLARFFRPVSDALFDGKDNETALRIWRNSERRDVGGKTAYQETGGYYHHRLVQQATRTVRARQLDKKHDWNTVK